MSVFFKASPNYDLQHGVLLSVFFNHESPPLPLLLSLIIIPYYYPLLSSLIIIPYYPISIRNLLHSPAYNPSTVAWVDETAGCFKVHFTDRQTEQVHLV